MRRADLQAVSTGVSTTITTGVGRLQSPLYNHHNMNGAPTVSSLQPSQHEWGAYSLLSTTITTGHNNGAPTVSSLQPSQQEWGAHSPLSTIVTTGVWRPQSPLYIRHNRSGAMAKVPSLQSSQQEWGPRPQSPLYNRHNRSGALAHSPFSTIVTTGVRALQSSQQE